MPVLLSTLIICIAVISGWLVTVIFTRILFRPYSPKEIIGFRFSGILPAMLPGLAVQVSGIVEKEFLSPETIAAKLDDPLLMQQLKPEIETHIDEFLKTKLKEAFPLLSNFMGEKTLSKFKEAFLTEVETILPGLLKTYSGRLLEEWQPARLVKDRIIHINVEQVEMMVRKKAARQLRLLRLSGALIGLFTGILQVIIMYLF